MRRLLTFLLTYGVGSSLGPPLASLAIQWINAPGFFSYLAPLSPSTTAPPSNPHPAPPPPPTPAINSPNKSDHFIDHINSTPPPSPSNNTLTRPVF